MEEPSSEGQSHGSELDQRENSAAPPVFALWRYPSFNTHLQDLDRMLDVSSTVNFSCLISNVEFKTFNKLYCSQLIPHLRKTPSNARGTPTSPTYISGTDENRAQLFCCAKT